MFKKSNGNHGLFCFCPLCRNKRKISLTHNIIISCLLLLTFYQCILLFFNFTKFNAFLLLLLLLSSVFFVVRSLF